MAVVAGQLLEARGHGPAFLQPARAPFDHVAAAIEIGDELRGPAAMPRLLIGSLRDRRTDAAAAQPASDAVIAVALVAGHVRRPDARASDAAGHADRVQHLLELRRLVTLAGGHLGRQGQSATVNDQVDLGPESAA
ncbi:hypothetical protein HK102_009889 [Quaeritorhiza haematococci]|nr:hypothetical protein HK102_009889 [Quaeritorhiza haematococci]